MSLLDDLVDEADRQLRICNACRYCEGYCAVYPALERRLDFTAGDVAHLSNLCHDCRACYHACMYTPPHEFAINPPEILSKVRMASYDEYLGAGAAFFRRRLRAWGSGILLAIVAIGVVMIGIAASRGLGAIWHTHQSGSPYSVISYGALLTIVLVPFALSVITIGRAAGRYWKATHGPIREMFDVHALHDASIAAAQLRYLRGGGAECTYPTDTPSAMRRWFHSFIAYGFTLCVVATIAAGVMEDIAGIQPPYGIISLPVLCGIVGGAGLTIGCTGLIWAKTRQDVAPSDRLETVANYGFLVGLDFLAVTGILTLVLRHDSGFGIVFSIHLAAIVLCFLVAPYTKFVHFVYRYLALVKDYIEIKKASAGASH